MLLVQPTSAVGSVTNGGLTQGEVSALRTIIRKFSWTNAMVAALSGTSGNILVCTLPAKTLVLKATVVLTGQASGVTALTFSIGRTATAYTDYVVAKSAKATVSTVYGQAITDVGTNLSAILGDLPSVTNSTDVNIQFVSSIENLSNVTGSSGDIYLETMQLP